MEKAADSSVSLSRLQQCEQTADGVGVVFQSLLGSEQTSHFTDVTDAL